MTGGVEAILRERSFKINGPERIATRLVGRINGKPLLRVERERLKGAKWERVGPYFCISSDHGKQLSADIGALLEGA
jgi:hypothetical protein